MIKKLILLQWLSCIVWGGYAQIPSQKIHLKTGDDMPNLPLGKMINYEGPERNIHDFKGKLLVLDFWATWCSPCLTGLVENDKLREEFGNRIAIIPITYEDATKAGAMLKKLKVDKATKTLFSIVDDLSIRAKFEFSELPHLVWIDKNGKIIKQTNADQLNSKNIRAVLNDQQMVLEGKSETIKRKENGRNVFLFRTGLRLMNDNGNYTESMPDSNILFRSILARNIENLHGLQQFGKNSFTAINATVQDLYKTVVGRMNMKSPYEFVFYMPDNRLVWERLDTGVNMLSNKYAGSVSGVSRKNNYARQHLYNYEIVVPKYTDEKTMYQTALENINLQFYALYGIKGNIEKRKIKCLVLKRTSTIDKLTSNLKENKIQDNKYGFEMKQQRFDWFFQRFVPYYLQHLETPIVDETGIPGARLVDMIIDCKLSDVVAINKELARYDLVFEEGDRVIDMIVIKQIVPGKLNAMLVP